MDELGSVLSEAREARGLTLEQIENELRIRSKFLAALEQGRYQDLPTPVHVRGYLRNYARYLGLDPEPLLDRYEVSRNYQKPPVSTKQRDYVSSDSPIPPRSDEVFYRPVNLSLDGESGNSAVSLVPMAIVIAALVVLALLVNRFVLNPESNEQLVEDAVAAALSNTPVVTTPLPDGVLPQSEAADGIIVATERNAIDLPTVTPTRPSLPATMEIINLRLEITERTWLRVTIDGEVQYQGQALQGDTLEYQALDTATLETGNAIAVFITINDVRLGKLGGRSEILQETWTTTSN
jgi:cytoskeletal protein RodZ